MTNEELFIKGDYDTLYQKNVKFIHHIAKKFGNLNIEYDELIALGNLAFAKLLKKYDPSKSKFITVFAIVITNEILMHQRKQKKRDKAISLESTLGTDKEGNSFSLLDTVCDDTVNIEQDIEGKVMLEQAIRRIKTLPSLECEIMMGYIAGETQHNMAKRLGLSQSYISRVISRVQIKLKKEVEKGTEIKEGKDMAIRQGSKRDTVFKLLDEGITSPKEIAAITGYDYGCINTYKYAYKKERMQMPKVEEEEIKVEIQEEFKQQQKEVVKPRLAISELNGLFTYKLDGGFLHIDDEISLNAEGIDSFIEELKEIKKYIA
ncbi:MAG: sigma-70 family RNA polymerase sigma factor [Zhenhengia sp.]|uniref:sigma-70 family RNA polymerase sigma factor n=1 Tax=Zhenhengia sp. TaxID=2944208 RepID=UPI00307A3CAB